MSNQQFIHTLVSVPVLSEQMTDTAPSVSTVFRDLQRILFFRMILAVMVKLAVNAMGRPSGMKATATLTQSTMSKGTLIHFGYLMRRYEALSNRQRVFPRAWEVGLRLNRTKG